MLDPQPLSYRQRWQHIWPVLRAYWVSREKWGAWGLLLLLVVILLIRTGLQVLFLIFGGELTSALAAQDRDRFVQALFIFLGVLAVGVPFASLSGYLGAELGLYWREWLTRRYLHRYLDDAQFYQLRLQGRVDNPDQRLEADIRTLTQESLRFLMIGLESVFQLIGIAGVLWAISQPLTVFLVVYSVVGTAIATFFFGRMLVGINYEQLRREADFRFGLARIRENAEAIALYRGETPELRQSWQQFLSAFYNFKRLIRWQLGLNLFQNHYRYATFVIPGLILAPRLFAGELEIGNVTQAGAAFSLMLGALALIVLQMQQLTNLAAAAQRLGQLDYALKQAHPSSPSGSLTYIQRQPGDAIALHHLTIQTPDGQTTLVRDLSVSVPNQQHLLIVGPSGVGKSSLLRAIAGLWQIGSGTITAPTPSDMMFLPQRPYLIQGSLRQQLLYPAGAVSPSQVVSKDPLSNRNSGDRAQESARNVSQISDDVMIAVLKQVNLTELLERWGGLDGGIEEIQTLSGGEQQRLAFARLLLKSPHYALLDEATSALDLSNEAQLYEALQSTKTTFISVGHRSSLRPYHQHVLEMFAEPGWTIEAIAGQKPNA
ncbi:ABC transporter ATP-binding protein/permease [Oscillatoria sp. CS-180]|uniref:ABC transporter ATP-binding protein/permease n=1 Tax=Oscillatoria sp. CS-180 TaxID=3021720 RepID=UPI00232F1D08|nr:ABC transporter ATP-binding protein/permease [Oscillatoria sp. CS-180]MDB9529361.1 ABC transporter ATP-binding protein/permease [Oscillatoria sp. CS-180]